VALTFAAQLTTLPVILLNFERLSLVAPLANVVVVPLVPLAMLASAVASGVGAIGTFVHPPLMGQAADWLAGGAAWITLRAMIVTGTAAASLPFAAVDVAVPAPLAVAWYPLLGLMAWARSGGGPPAPADLQLAATAAVPPGQGWLSGLGRGLRRVARVQTAGIGLVVVLGTITLGSRPDGRLHLTVLDVGQGDAILIEAPTGAIALIDGGPDPELGLRRLGEALPFWARDIKVLLLSHPHQDHVAGLPDVLVRHRVRLVLHAGIAYDNPAYGQFLTDAGEEPGGQLALARAGAVISLDANTRLELLYPTAADAALPLPDGDINNASVVALLRHGAFTALLTGDAEAPIERLLLERDKIPPLDVLKVGHHGSDSSTTPALVEIGQPAVAIISAGARNEYGHPHAVTLDTLADAGGIAVYRTDRDGSVEVVSDGRGYAVRTRNGTSAWRLTHAIEGARSIGAWPSLTSVPPVRCSPATSCPTGSWSTRRAYGAWRWRRPGWWRRPGSRSTAAWSPRRRCCTTSTSRTSGAPAASMGWWAPACSPPPGTPSWPCRSPPIR